MMRRLLIVWVGLLTLVLNVGAQDSELPNRFGIVEGFWLPELACELGVGWERIIFNWEQHQPTNRDDWYTLNVDDRWLSGADGCNREVVALLKHTPTWATDGTAGVGVPRGLELPIDDPDNLWANFVRRTVDYYASRGVTHYIIWNEPDIDETTYGYEFEGDLDDYFLMLKVAYLAAQSVNPAAKIHLAGTTYWHDVNEGREPYMSRLVARILEDPDAANHDYYFDVLSLHIYFKTDTVYEIVGEMRSMLDSYGLDDKAIWINETNAAPTQDPNWAVVRPVFNLDLGHQADFVVQSAVLGLAAGAERIAVYKLYDQQLPEGGESFGITSPADGSPRPAYDAWRMVAGHLNDVSETSIAQNEDVTVVRLVHVSGQQTIVAWSREEAGAVVRLRVSGQKVYRLALDGTRIIERPTDGEITLRLDGALCENGEGCFLGGHPVMIVQPAGEVLVWQMDDDNNLIELNWIQESSVARSSE